MSTISCYEPACDEEAEVSCNCTSPDTYSCEKHLFKHCKSSKEHHNISSIFLDPIKETQGKIISFLAEENSKTAITKIKTISSFVQTLGSYENALEDILKEIDSDAEKTRIYLEKVSMMQKQSRLEKDPVLSLLALEPHEAIEKAKSIFTKSGNLKLFYEMESQINKTIGRFNEEKSKVIQSEIPFNIENSELFNFEKKRKSIKPVLSEYKEAISISPNIDNSFNRIGDIFYGEKRYKEALKFYNDAIRANRNRAIYYTNKGQTLKKLRRNDESLECLKEAIRIDPNNDNAWGLIGNFYLNEKRYEEAKSYYNAAIKINSNKAIYYTYINYKTVKLLWSDL